MVMGLILEPNKLIYRNQNGNEFNIVFTEQDIEDTLQSNPGVTREQLLNQLQVQNCAYTAISFTVNGRS